MHGARNVPTYLDVEAYAETLRAAEVEHGQSDPLIQRNQMTLRVIPDIAAGTVMDPVHAQGRDSNLYPSVDAVVFAANGIIVNQEVTIAHTCGHLAIAATAKQLGVPTFVLSSAAKIQTAKMGRWQVATREDKGKWIGSASSGVLDGLNKHGASIDWNPREDHVPVSLVDAILTDLGTCKCNNKDIAQKLIDWEKQIDEEVEQKRYLEQRQRQEPELGIDTASIPKPTKKKPTKKKPTKKKPTKK
jgi:hypothetical protein